jgi:hypothetical protein
MSRLAEVELLIASLEIVCGVREGKVLGIRCAKCIQISQISQMRHCFACKSNLDIRCYTDHNCGFEYDLHH